MAAGDHAGLPKIVDLFMAEIVLGQDFIRDPPADRGGPRVPLGISGRNYGSPDNLHPFHGASCDAP